MSYNYFIGIDIGKDSFDVAVHAIAAKPQRFPNSSEGFAAMMTALEKFLPRSLIVIEATGGYESALISALCASRLAVHRVQPLAARHYMRSLRCFAKNDALDAAALARYGAERHESLRLFTPADDTQQALIDLHTRRNDLVAMRAAETARIKHPRYARLGDCVKEICAVLDRRIADIEQRIQELIESDEKLRTRKEILCAFKGIGNVTAATLIASMPELGTLTRRQAASLAGLAPHPNDSGKHQGYRATRGGRAAVRKALFMAALSAKRYNPQLKTFYERLIKAGKKPIVALIATMRKMIVILNAKMRDELFAKTW